jgi:hypothetical protein
MNYEGLCRTNYFHVTNEKRFNQITAGLRNARVEKRNDDTYCILIDDTLSYYPPLSDYPDIIKENNNEFYDEDGNRIKESDYDDYETLYDKDGNLIFDRFIDNDEMCFDSDILDVIPENEVFVYIEIGHEGFRSLDGATTIISHKGKKFIALNQFIDQAVEELLGEGESTKYTY